VSHVPLPGLKGSAPFVSIQRVDLTDPLEGHLGWGVLISSDTVVVDLAEWPADGRLEVLLASQEGPVVERIEMAKVEIVGGKESALAAVKLAHASLQTPTAADFDLRAVQRELKGNQDIWGGLEQLGYVPKGIRDTDTASVLGQITKWEDLLRNGLIHDGRPQSIDSVALRMCCFWRCKSCRDEF
jgi:hypothetical protein